MCILIKTNSGLTRDKMTKNSTFTTWSIVSNKEEARNLFDITCANAKKEVLLLQFRMILEKP